MDPPAHLTGRVGGSEDLLYMEMPAWTAQEIAEADRFREAYDLLQSSRVKEYQVHTKEYPDIPDEAVFVFGNPIPYEFEPSPPTEEELAAQQRRAKNRSSLKARLLSGAS